MAYPIITVLMPVYNAEAYLREAIESEEYERAAKIRDDIQKLTSDN